MTNSIFRQSILVSLLGHIAVFSVFSFSFGPKISAVNFTSVSFRGAILRGSDLLANNIKIEQKTRVVVKKSEMLLLDKINREPRPIVNNNWREKPPISLAFNQDKMAFILKPMPISLAPSRKEPIVMFYPKLPYHFSLYFKDRQVAHIELNFSVVSVGKRNSILIKRKASSGNLEADLLSMRYISRYLFIQQAAFAVGNWQSVKIDLSALND